MRTYTTIQGDTFDSIAFRMFGDEAYMEKLIKANWEHADTLVFSSGTTLIIPEIEESSVDDDAPFWRADDDEDDEEEDDG